MDKNQYNEHLTKFHADTFRDYLIKREGNDRSYGQSPEQFINHAFHSYIHVYNNSLAKPFLDSLKRNIVDLTLSQQFDKISTDFPEIYLQSEDANKYKRELLNKFVNQNLTNLFNQDEPLKSSTIKRHIVNTLGYLSEIVRNIEENDSSDLMASYTASHNYLTEINRVSFQSLENKDITPFIKPESIKEAILEILETNKQDLEKKNCEFFVHALQSSVEEITKYLNKNQVKPLKVTM